MCCNAIPVNELHPMSSTKTRLFSQHYCLVMYDDKLYYRQKIKDAFFLVTLSSYTMGKHFTNIIPILKWAPEYEGHVLASRWTVKSYQVDFHFFLNLLITLNSKSLINRIEHRNFLIDYFGKRPEDFVVKTDFVKGLKKKPQ